MTNQDNLIALLKHPQVKKKLDLGMLLGLSGHAKIDYAVGVIERTIEESKENLTNSSLKRRYDLLKKDFQYKSYFPKTEKTKPLNPEDRRKNPAYKALNGF